MTTVIYTDTVIREEVGTFGHDGCCAYCTKKKECVLIAHLLGDSWGDERYDQRICDTLHNTQGGGNKVSCKRCPNYYDCYGDH